MIRGVLASMWLPLLVWVGTCQSARILGVNPTPSISHQQPMRAILLELAKRGHEVTFITTDPIQDPTENYTEVDLSDTYPYLRKAFSFNVFLDMSPTRAMEMFVNSGNYLCEFQLNTSQMKSFMKLEKKFDLFFMEKIGYACYYGLAHKVGSPPLVGFVSFGGLSYVLRTFGFPANPSYFPEPIGEYTDHMTFGQRMYNAYYMLYSWYYVDSVHLPEQEAIMRKYFGAEPPPVKDVDYNFSLLLTNNHFSQSYPRPNPPNVIELTGLQIEKSRKALPKNVKEFLDEAEEGVLYFSLGSNVKSSVLAPETVEAIVEAFAEIPQRVLWKWETDHLPGQPKNVMVSKWIPQQDVLAHPNIHLFITQGGLQSMNEAAYHSVPVICIPFIDEQKYNVAKLVSAGVGRKLDVKDITKDSLLLTIRSVLQDKSYRENMKRFSALFREHQETSMERAVWWMEYVIRHKGAPHLRSAALDLRWWQLLLLDVIAFILAVAAVAAYIVYRILSLTISYITRPSKVKTH